MATRKSYYGDADLAATYQPHADLLLESLRRSLPDVIPSTRTDMLPDGTKVFVARVTPEMDFTEIWAGKKTTKDKYVWTLLYAPCPWPDPQDWPGWIECDVEDLIADNFENNFLLLPWGDAFYGDFSGDAPDTIVSSPSAEYEYGGWYAGMYGNEGSYLGPLWQGVYLERCDNTRSEQTITYTFPYDLFAPASVTNYSQSGYKHWRQTGGPFDTHGWCSIPSNVYPYPPQLFYPPPPEPDSHNPRGTYDPGYTIGGSGGYLSWESLYLIGFWKWEWVFYTASSFVDFDNYVGFYDHYDVYHSYSSTYLTDSSGLACADYEEWFWPGADGYEAYWWTTQMRIEYIAAGLTGSGDHVSFPKTSVNNWTGPGSSNTIDIAIHDPDSDGSGGSVGTIDYTTHICGKYNGSYFDEVVVSASWEGSSAWGVSGAWSGECGFAWMARFYDKQYLLEGDVGEEVPSEHHLMIASWLSGPAAGYPSDTNVVPGCTGITATTYRAKHGSTDVTKSYGASHPGWHDVYTQDERTWRAYGDLFAALKKVEGV